MCKSQTSFQQVVDNFLLYVYNLQNVGSLCAPSSFQHLCENVSKGQSESVARNLSVPICFVCLLHLANEKVSSLSSIFNFNYVP